jgi:hypothetical protein
MFATNHVTRRPVREAVKATRAALNHALDVAEPRLEKAAGGLEDLSRDAVKALRETSRDRLDELKGTYSKLEKRMRKQLPKKVTSQRLGKMALIAAGLALVTFGLFR